MRELMVIAEHRRGELREVTFECLGLARSLAGALDAQVACALLGLNVSSLGEVLASYADRVLVVEHEALREFNSDVYGQALSSLIKERRPFLVVMGHTAMGIELMPSLAVKLGVPLATDCVEVKVRGGEVLVTRQVYGGKVNVELALRSCETYMVTVRPGAFPMEAAKPIKGEVVRVQPPALEVGRKRFLGYVEPPKAEVDITKADVIVSVGRGIRDAKNIPMVEELAKALKGVVGCSRPVADKGWLPKDRHIGMSGKTVKPKLYLALGISGAFQHVMGMNRSQLIIAVNRDPSAPIFKVAHYGVVDDLFKIVPALKNEIARVKGGT